MIRARITRSFENAWRAAQQGDALQQPVHVLTFESLAGFLAGLTEKRWMLLQYLRNQGPLSIRALADALGRNYKNVHTDVRRLLELDLIERDEKGLVLVCWDEIDARIALAA